MSLNAFIAKLTKHEGPSFMAKNALAFILGKVTREILAIIPNTTVVPVQDLEQQQSNDPLVPQQQESINLPVPQQQESINLPVPQQLKGNDCLAYLGALPALLSFKPLPDGSSEMEVERKWGAVFSMFPLAVSSAFKFGS